MLAVSRPKPLTKSRVHYTIHSSPNFAFTLKSNENVKTSLVSFKNLDNAVLMGRMIEAHFYVENELPDTRTGNTLILPSPDDFEELTQIYIQSWEFEELKLYCTKNILDNLCVNSITNSKSGFSLNGDMLRFSAPSEFYRLRFEELLPTEPMQFP